MYRVAITVQVLSKRPKISVGRNCFCLLCFLFFSGSVFAEEKTRIWTESLSSKQGTFAFMVDLERNRLLVLRSDNRNLGVLRIRWRIYLPHGDSKEMLLRRVESLDRPEKYFGEFAVMSGSIKEFDLESSADGSSWKLIGHFTRF